MTKSTKNKAKVIVGIVALLLAAFIGVAIWQGTANFPKWFPKQEQQQQPGGELDSGNSGLIAPETHEANGVSFKALSIPVAQYNDYGVSAAAETALQLTVKVTPENADVSDGKFTIAFKNASSAWAKGKTVSQYVTLNQSDSTHATVSCLKAFGEQIIVTYTVTGENGNVTATYPLDYAKKVIEWGLKRDDGNALMSDATASNSKFIYVVLNKATYYALSDEFLRYSDYTVDDTFSIDSTSTFKLTESFKSACSSAGVSLAGANKTGIVTDSKLLTTNASTTMLSYYFGDSVWKTEAFRNVVNAQNDVGIFQADVTLVGTYSQYSASITMGIVVTTLPVASQSVQWQSSGGSNTGHIF